MQLFLNPSSWKGLDRPQREGHFCTHIWDNNSMRVLSLLTKYWLVTGNKCLVLN